MIHLVSFEETKVSSAKKMVGIIHDYLVSCGVEKRGLRERERKRERERGEEKKEKGVGGGGWGGGGR